MCCDFKGAAATSLGPECICGSVGSFDPPRRGIIGASKGEAALVPVMSGGTAGTSSGEDITMVEGEWLFGVSEPERLCPVGPLTSIWDGVAPRCIPRCGGVCSCGLPESLLRRGDRIFCCSRTNPRKRFRRSHLAMFTVTNLNTQGINCKHGNTHVAVRRQSFFLGHSQPRRHISPPQSNGHSDEQSIIPS